ELGDSDRVFYLTTKTERSYWDVEFQKGDYLIFGRETKGLPESMLDERPERCLTIPQEGTRSLNLATAVGIVLYDGVRQLQGSSAP
ncbi:MAG: TrmH family RNA methyltransferase, partial [Verrucomicrobiota bacterium]